MTEEIKCQGCGCQVGEIIEVSEDPKNTEKPDGLSHGKTKILQVNLQHSNGDRHYHVFEYYVEYGLDGIVLYRDISQNGEMQGPYWLSIRTLAAFVDHFRKELEGSH